VHRHDVRAGPDPYLVDGGVGGRVHDRDDVRVVVGDV
jgi:hypothetical protein